jgi:hypothetical protein
MCVKVACYLKETLILNNILSWSPHFNDFLLLSLRRRSCITRKSPTNPVENQAKDPEYCICDTRQDDRGTRRPYSYRPWIRPIQACTDYHGGKDRTGKGSNTKPFYVAQWEWLLKIHLDILPNSTKSIMTWETVGRRSRPVGAKSAFVSILEEHRELRGSSTSIHRERLKTSTKLSSGLHARRGAIARLDCLASPTMQSLSGLLLPCRRLIWQQ